MKFLFKISQILILLSLKMPLINTKHLNNYDPNEHSPSSFFSLLNSFSIFQKNFLSPSFPASLSSSFSESPTSSEVDSKSNSNSEETDGEEEKREKSWKEALKRRRTVDLLQQRKHTGDIVQLWEEETIKMRNALRSDSNNRWTSIRDTDGKYVIPFIITGKYTRRQRSNIQRAMDSIAKNTCVKFRSKRKNEYDYVRGRQVLMLESGWSESCGWGCLLAYPGCTDHSTIIHELMHKVGLWHEQMRYDRDKYIKIHWENIIPGLRNQFGKIGREQSTTYNLPYDYKSVMHYKKNAGANSEYLVTMETRDKRYAV